MWFHAHQCLPLVFSCLASWSRDDSWPEPTVGDTNATPVLQNLHLHHRLTAQSQNACFCHSISHITVIPLSPQGHVLNTESETAVRWWCVGITQISCSSSVDNPFPQHIWHILCHLIEYKDYWDGGNREMAAEVVSRFGGFARMEV